jgi:peptide/nickel transport system substrate-binding protein
MTLLRRVSGIRLPSFRQMRHMIHMCSGREKQMYTLGMFGLVVSLIWGGVIALSFFRIQVPAVGGSYTEGVVGTIQRLNPIYAPLSDAEMDISRLLFSGLLRIDTKGRLVPDIAANYTISDDKKVYTFTLRNDVLWHDKEPLTAKDVAFTIETIQRTEAASPLLVSFQGVAVSVLDDYTVSFTLSEPFPAFLHALTVGIIPEHVWVDTPLATMPIVQKNLQPVGSGPFKLQKIVKDENGSISEINLERFDEYYRQPPFLHNISFSFFSDYEGDGGVIAALRQGHVDGLHVVPNDLRDKVERRGVDLYTLQFPQYTALFLNQQNDALKQVVVREALSVAIDKKRLLKDAIDSNGFIIEDPMLPGFPGYVEPDQVSSTPFSLEQANTLLDKSYPRIPAQQYVEQRKEELLARAVSTANTALIAETPISPTVSTTLYTSSTLPSDILASVTEQIEQEISEAQTFYRKSGDDILRVSLVTVDTVEYRAVAERIAGFWQEIGIKTDLSFVAAKDFSRTVLRPRAYDVLLYGVVLGSDPDQFAFWHSSQVAHPGLNLSQYVNPAVDTILVQARAAFDSTAQEPLYRALAAAIRKDRPAIFLYSPTYTYVLPSKIQGTSFSRIFVPSDRFAGVIHWYIKTKRSWQWKSDTLTQ